jgi:hypothetical protein
MNTSYFAKSGNNPNAVSISVGTPRWFPNIRRYPKLAPPYDLLDRYRHGSVSVEQYTQEYHERILAHLDAKTVYCELGEEAILLCHETREKFCHRHLVADWLNKELELQMHGLGVSELE